MTMSGGDLIQEKLILVVDDEPSITLLCKTVLTLAGYQVDTAQNGKTAQQMLSQKKYDVCLLDIRTPQMNGKELFHWLQETSPDTARKVVITTGDVLSGDTPEFLESFEGIFLAKPFTPKELLSAVRKII